VAARFDAVTCLHDNTVAANPISATAGLVNPGSSPESQGELIVHSFSTGSKGLTSTEYRENSPQPEGVLAFLKRMFVPELRECAVCIPDGAQLRLDGISQKLQKAHNLSATEMITFRQLSANFAK
jgi:hypothetical protein